MSIKTRQNMSKCRLIYIYKEEKLEEQEKYHKILREILRKYAIKYSIDHETKKSSSSTT